NTVNEAGPDYFAPVGRSISIAPAGDLFDAFIPVSEIIWTDETPYLTTDVLDDGIFTLVLAVERAVGSGCVVMPMDRIGQPEPGCNPGCETAVVRPEGHKMDMPKAEGREIVYYTFRFVVR
ncbi:hypothetical protein KAH43_04695, partial [Candidatus Bipolaricaulota bacterium]|nr:hypothetical protein [Candidatus Bipolaricaulota bacterium]